MREARTMSKPVASKEAPLPLLRGERELAHSLPSRPKRPRLASAWDSDLAYSFRRSPVTIIAAVLVALCIGGALLAPWVAPHNPFDLASFDLLDAFPKPVWHTGGKPTYLLGTDNQGRDVLSAI